MKLLKKKWSLKNSCTKKINKKGIAKKKNSFTPMLLHFINLSSRHKYNLTQKHGKTKVCIK